MIDLYYWPTPNGHKITIFLEETKTAYKLIPVAIGKGDQFKEEFLKISPNNKMPAIVDHKPAGGGEPFSLFESGAILHYLGEKTGQFLPQEPKEKFRHLEWLYWQMGGLGPMLGQNHHFSQYAPEKIPYAIERYQNETHRLYSVANKRLSQSQFLGGDDFGIADMAAYPWIVPYEKQGQDLNEFPHLKKWFESIANRPAVKVAYEKGKEVNSVSTMTEEAKKILFGQKGRS